MTYVGAKRVITWHLPGAEPGIREREERAIDGSYAVWLERTDTLEEGDHAVWGAEHRRGGQATILTLTSPSKLDAKLACEEHAQKMPT
jgi:hypothetical protein